MTNITKAAQTSTETWSFWEALPGHLIDKYEKATLTEELLQEAAASLHAKLRAEQPARQEPCSGPLCGLPEFGEHHPLCNLHLRAALQDKAGEVADFQSRSMFVARLENMQANGDAWLTVPAVLALLNDCDMLASTELSAQPAPVVPEGFAIVPVEPTAAMIQAGIDKMPHFTDEPGPVWSAMLAAVALRGDQAALAALRPAVEPMTPEQRDTAIDAKLAEYGYPANTRNAARAGWYACLQALCITAKAEDAHQPTKEAE